MIRNGLRSRSFLAAVGFLAVVGLLGASVASVQAFSVQEQEEEQSTAEEENDRLAVEKAMEAARLAMRAQGANLKRHLAQARAMEGGRLQALQERLHEMLERGQQRGQRRVNVLRQRGGPDVQIRTLRGHRGGSAQAILAQAEEIGLSDDQIAQLRQLRDGDRRATIERNAAIEMGELDLHGLLEDEDSADLGAVEAQMREISNLRVDARVAALRLKRSVDAVLTPEQRDEVGEMGHNVFMRRHGGPGVGAFFMRDGDEVFDFDMDFDGDFDLENVFEFEGDHDGANVMLWKSKEGHEEGDEDAGVDKKKQEKEKKEKQGFSIDN